MREGRWSGVETLGWGWGDWRKVERGRGGVEGIGGGEGRRRVEKQ